MEPEEIKEVREGDIERIAAERREVIAQKGIDSSLQKIMDGEPVANPNRVSETWEEFLARKIREGQDIEQGNQQAQNLAKSREIDIER